MQKLTLLVPEAQGQGAFYLKAAQWLPPVTRGSCIRLAAEPIQLDPPVSVLRTGPEFRRYIGRVTNSIIFAEIIGDSICSSCNQVHGLVYSDSAI
jgi:hypothetical protein